MRTLVVQSRRLAVALCAVSGCATVTPEKTENPVLTAGSSAELASARPTPVGDASLAVPGAALLGELGNAVQSYCDAWSEGDWATVWSLTATVDRSALLSVGRRVAERHDATARTQGFESAAALRGLSDEAWFTRSRAALRALGTLPALAPVVSLAAGEAVSTRFGESSVSVVPVRLTLGSGATTTLGAVREGVSWRFISP